MRLGDAKTCVVAESWLVIVMTLVFYRESSRVNNGAVFYNSASDTPYHGSISAFLAPWLKPAGGWYIHRHTCWVGVGGLITGWKKIIWWIRAVVTTEWEEALLYNVPPAWRHWEFTVILSKSHSRATSSTSLACRHALTYPEAWSEPVVTFLREITVHIGIIILYRLQDNNKR